jgi:hypothetical protein
VGKEASTSFLKKRSKRLSNHGRAASPERTGSMNESFFGSFFSKKELLPK